MLTTHHVVTTDHRKPVRHALVRRLGFLAMGVLCLSQVATAQLRVVSEFNPSMASSLCSIAIDPTVDPSTGGIWVYECNGSNVQNYTSTGEFVSSVNIPAEAANDVDLDFSSGPLELGATQLPLGTLLFVNGESGPAEVYGLDKSTGSVLATLQTEFGVSHVVGGAHHPGRNSIFLVQDRVPGTVDRNRIAEVSPSSGTPRADFGIGSVFDVNYGDVDVCPSTDNLYVVSSAESRIAELAPDGTLIGYQNLPAGVSGLSGIAIATRPGVAWVSGTGGKVWQLEGLSCGLFAEDGFETGDTSRWSRTVSSGP